MTLPPMRSSLGSPGLQTVSLSNNTDTHCMTPTTRLTLNSACMCALSEFPGTRPHAGCYRGQGLCYRTKRWQAPLSCESLFRSTVHALACTLVVWDMSFDLWSPTEEKHGCVRQSGRLGSRASPPHALRRRWLAILRKVGRDSREPTWGRTPAILSRHRVLPEFGRAVEPEFRSVPSRGQWWGVGVF